VADEQLVYLDTSAFVKLAIPEPETAALIAALPTKARLVASEILEVEALRAVRRATGEDGTAAARTQLAGVRLLPLTDQIRKRACELEPATLRSLDAIHVATALDLGELLACMYAYDARMANAASDAGIEVYAPYAPMTEAPTTEDTQTEDPADPNAAEGPPPKSKR
jgi:predicted nucleic acid-binding protein